MILITSTLTALADLVGSSIRNIIVYSPIIPIYYSVPPPMFSRLQRQSFSCQIATPLYNLLFEVFCDAIDILHNLNRPREYSMIDSLKDVVVICGRGDAIGVVDVTGAEWLRCEVCFVWILEMELRKDCFKIVGRHEGELWNRECNGFCHTFATFGATQSTINWQGSPNTTNEQSNQHPRRLSCLHYS